MLRRVHVSGLGLRLATYGCKKAEDLPSNPPPHQKKVPTTHENHTTFGRCLLFPRQPDALLFSWLICLTKQVYGVSFICRCLPCKHVRLIYSYTTDNFNETSAVFFLASRILPAQVHLPNLFLAMFVCVTPVKQVDKRKSGHSAFTSWLPAGHRSIKWFFKPLSCNTDGWLNTKSLKAATSSSQEVNASVLHLHQALWSSAFMLKGNLCYYGSGLLQVETVRVVTEVCILTTRIGSCDFSTHSSSDAAFSPELGKFPASNSHPSHQAHNVLLTKHSGFLFNNQVPSLPTAVCLVACLFLCERRCGCKQQDLQPTFAIRPWMFLQPVILIPLRQKWNSLIFPIGAGDQDAVGTSCCLQTPQLSSEPKPSNVFFFWGGGNHSNHVDEHTMNFCCGQKKKN